MMDIDHPVMPGCDAGLQALTRWEDTFLTLEQTAIERRFDMPFHKTYPVNGVFINDWHRHLSQAAGSTGMIEIGVEGWLLPVDALKLYELGYFCGGDILELGTYFHLNPGKGDSGFGNRTDRGNCRPRPQRDSNSKDQSTRTTRG